MAKELRIRLEQNTPPGKVPATHDFRIFDADTGEEIVNILRLEIDLDAEDITPVVHLTLFGPSEVDGLEVVADVETERV